MTAYGLTITPKSFVDTTAKQMTKSQFLCYMHKALLTVGMLQIQPLNPPGFPDLGAVTEFNFHFDSNNAIWYYDFPVSDTFMVNNIAYRPCLAMVGLNYQSGNSQNSVNGETVTFHLVVRRADRIFVSDINHSAYWIYSTNNFGFLSYNDTWLGPQMGMEGAYIVLPSWRSSFLGSPQNPYYSTLLSVQNFQIILTKGGLLIQVGTGTTRSDNNNILNFMCVFGGQRVPGYGRVPMSDPNLNRINPTLLFCFRSVGTRAIYYAGGATATNLSLNGPRYISMIQSMQHDLKSTPHPVFAQCFNLENIQKPLFPLCGSDTKSSPRLIAGQGADILQRLVYCSWWDQSLAQSSVFSYYGPSDPSIRPEPVPTWADVWTAEGFRFCDKTAPQGDFVDPVTGFHWHLFFCPQIPMVCAINTDGVTTYTSFTSHVKTLNNTWHMDFSPGGLSGPFPLSSLFTTSGPHVWTSSPGTDQALNSNWGAGGGDVEVLAGHLLTPAAVAGYNYTVSFKAFNYNTYGTIGSVNPLQLQYSIDGGATWITAATLYQSLGSYALTPQGEFPVLQGTDGTIMIRFVLTSNYSGGLSAYYYAGVGDIVLNQYATT